MRFTTMRWNTGYGFYCLTSSLDDQIEQWKDKTGAEYPFCLMDDITLKTMIRSNPRTDVD